MLAYNNLEGSYRGTEPAQRGVPATLRSGRLHPARLARCTRSFRIMVGIGMLLLLTAFIGLFLWWRRRGELERDALVPARAPAAGSARCPWLANFFGWITTEMGRQPFMVYGLLTVEQGVSANSVGEVLAGLIGLWVVYLGADRTRHLPAVGHRTRRASTTRRGPDPAAPPPTTPTEGSGLVHAGLRTDDGPRRAVVLADRADVHPLLLPRGLRLRRRHPAADARPDRGRGARADRHDRPVLGRQRGLGDRRGRRHVLDVPGLVRRRCSAACTRSSS